MTATRLRFVDSYFLKRLIAIFFLTLYVNSAFADNVLNINWTVPSTETTYQLLVYLFGTVSNDLVCSTGGGSGCNTLIPMLFNLLNQGILGIGVIVISYVMFMAAGHSAQDGEFLGKKNSSLWVPARIVGSLYFLVPSYNGYSLLQGLIMRVVLMGVALANNIYGLVDNYVTTTNTTFAREQVNAAASSTMLDSIVKFSQDIFPLQLCYAYYQSRAAGDGSIATAPLSTIPEFSQGNPYLPGAAFYNCPNFFSYYYLTTSEVQALNMQSQSVCSYGDSNAGGMLPPQSNPFPATGCNICGYFQYTFNQQDPNHDGTALALRTLEAGLYQQAQLLVQYYYSSNYKSLLSPNTVSGIQLSIEQILQLAVNDMITASRMAAMSQNSLPTNISWLEFPLNFYEWLGKGSTPPVTSIYGTIKTARGTISTGTDTTYDGFVSAVNDCQFFTTAHQATLQAPVKNSKYAPVKYMYNTMQDMIASTNDPLITLGSYGQQLLKISIDILFSSILIGGAVVGVSAICSCNSPGFASGMWLATTGLMMSILLAFGFLIPMGVTLGIYLPLLPLMMYSLGALNWFMLVVEGMVAGPIIALGIVAPSQDNLGKSQPALIMLFNLFLRPSLMIMGIIFGAKMFDLFIVYFSNVMIVGFEFIGKQGDFGDWFAIIFIFFWYFYSFMVVVVAQRSYALIYELPDKVLRWIGDRSASMGGVILQDIKTIQRGLNSGGEALQEEMSNSASGMLSLSQETLQKNNK